VSDFLTDMIAGARERVAEAQSATPLQRPAGHPGSGRLCAALARPHAGADGGLPPRLALIAEVKRRSPSKGDIAPTLDATTQATAYEAAGADAVSVLTEPSRFGGSLDDLRDVAQAVRLPVLRKDFIVDAYQLWEAAAAGAAAVLLIAAALPDAELAALLAESRACGLDALVEVHDEHELDRAVAAGASLVGVNNRNLRTLTVDLSVTERLGPLAPPGTILVGESGITSPADARRMAAAGAHALLVGEALVREGRGQLPDRIRALRYATADDGRGA
jgi:indole-3-glycerol phosphate synthase